MTITSEPTGTDIHVNHTVNLTCHVSHFYPSHLHLTWMENRHKIHTVWSPQVTRNPDGTYSLEHMWPAKATLDRREFACWVVQDDQPAVQTNITLRARAPRLLKGGCSLSPSPTGLLGWEGRCEDPSTWGADTSR